MRQFTLLLEKIIPLIHNMLIPSFIFGFSLIYFYYIEEIPLTSRLTLHHTYFALSCLSLLILAYFKKGISVFFILSSLLCYIFINYLKNTYSVDFRETTDFINLCFFIPLNLFVFYYWSQKELNTRINLYFFIFLLAEISAMEYLHRYNIPLNFSPFSTPSSLTFISSVMFALILLTFFITCINSGKVLDYAYLFVSGEILLGLYYADSSSALTIFFSASSLTIFIASSEYIYADTYKDERTGFSSQKAFMLQHKNFPLKYSIGVVKIDNYTNFKIAFRKRGLNKLLKMIAQRINSCEIDANIYRYHEDELIIIFKNIGKNDAYTQMEQIRRSIASASFMLSNFRKPIKLTITASVSEKKRSDATALEALERTYKTLQETIKFSQNVTSKI